MQSITIHSPCKINLSLDIVRRLPNGYHEMDMVMQTVDLCDTLTVSLHTGSDIQMTCAGLDGKPLPLACDDSNLAVRCTRAFFEHCGFSALPYLVVIHLIKRIPMMAGLGGGSADGAAVLAALSHLTQSGLSLEQLEQIAVGCGADIPFCLRGGTQRAQGIGEDFSPLSPMPDCPILIIKPRFGISTKDAFARSDSTAFSHAQVQRMCQALDTGSVLPIADCLQNVFEQLCSADEQKLLHQARQLLIQNGALGALLSGSGSALFGLFDNEAVACAARSALQDHPLLEGVFLCRPLPFGAFEAVRNSLRNPS